MFRLAKFSLYMLKREKGKSLFYVFTATFTILIMYLFLNLLYNPSYYGSMELYGGRDYNKIFSVMISFLTIAIAVGMNFFAYSFYLDSQTKEIGIYLLGGSTLFRLFGYLFIQNLVIYGIALVFGLGLGYVAVPVVNYVIGMIAGYSYPLYVYSSTALYGTVVLAVITLFYLAVVAAGFIHQHSIKDLLGMQTEMVKGNDRVFIIPDIVYFIIFMIPLIVFVFVRNPQYVMVLAVVALIYGFKGMCQYFIPPKIVWFQRKFLYEDKLRLIATGNFNQVLQSSCSAIQIFLIVSLFMNTYMLSNANVPLKLGITAVTYFFLTISVTLGMAYKILLDTRERKITFQHLYKLGYSKKEMTSMIRKEIIYLYGFGLAIFGLYMCLFYIPNILDGIVSWGFFFVNVGYAVLVLIICGIVSYLIYKKEMGL